MNSAYLMKAFISLMILTFLSACQSNSDKSLTGFFDEVSDNTDFKRFEDFKNSEIDSTGNTIKLFYEEISDAYNKFGSKYNLGIYSDSTGRVWDDSTKILCLTVAYHLYSNNKQIDFETVKSEFKKMTDYQWRKEILQSAKEDDELANLNSSNFKTGDTMSVCLLIDNDISKEYLHYYCGGILSDQEYFSRFSTNLSGILLSKSQGESNPTGRDLIFNIKVLEIGRVDVMMSNKITKIGDTIELNVTSYRRLINRGITRNCSQI